MAMTHKQQAFIAEYIKDFNATRSAIAAGYSQKTARSIGQHLLTLVDIDAAIKAEISERAMDKDEVLQRLADIARGDMADLMDITTMGFTLNLTIHENGKIIPNPKTKLIKKIKQKVTTHIAKSESDEDREVVETEVELYSAQEALNTLGKYHGLLTEKIDVTTKGEKIQTNDGYDRAVSALADVIREAVHNPDAKQDGALAASIEAAVVSPAKSGG